MGDYIDYLAELYSTNQDDVEMETTIPTTVVPVTTSTTTSTPTPTITVSDVVDETPSTRLPTLPPTASGLTMAVIALWMPLAAIAAAALYLAWRAIKKTGCTSSCTQQPRPEV